MVLFAVVSPNWQICVASWGTDAAVVVVHGAPNAGSFASLLFSDASGGIVESRFGAALIETACEMAASSCVSDGSFGGGLAAPPRIPAADVEPARTRTARIRCTRNFP